MALSLKDRVRESSATTGTGTITLAGAYVGFQTFASAVSDGDTVYYTIHNTGSGVDGEWEVGIGTFTASGTTLSRDTILSSSNSGSAVNFSAGTKEVFITQPAEKAVFEDASNNVTVGGKITVGSAPTDSLDVATKAYVDNATAAALHYHDPVRVESPTALTVTYNNGSSGVGATLTNAGTQAALVIDGITLSTTDRVLVYTQADATQNGVYTVTNVGSGSTNWVLTRATDADTYNPSDPDAMGQGDAFYVSEGATGAGESYVLTTQGTITFGTTAITYSQFASSPQPGDGTLTMNVSGTGLSGSQTFTANQTGNATFTVTSNATNANTASTIVARDASGNFSAGTITANLTGNVTGNLTGNVTGNADTATTATNATNVGLTNTYANANFYLPFASNAATGNYALWVDSNLYYNPYINYLYTGGVSAGYGNFTGITVTSYIDLSDADYLRFGTSDDTLFFYDGVNNTMEIELESACNSLLITDNGTTRFTFTKSTGNLTATSFTGNLTGDVTGNADTATSATTAGSVTNSVTFNNGGLGDASGTAYNGGAASTISYNTVGAPSTSGTGASGTWGISITGNAGTATSASSATSATNATNALNVNVATSTTASAFKVPFANTTVSSTGNYALLQDSTATFTYNPNTNVLTVGSVTGDLTGNADTATIATTATTANQVSNSVSFGTSGGDTAPISFDGSVARSVSYNTVGAPSTSGTNATGTWGISITGNAATATSATSATSATDATNADNVAITTSTSASAFKVPFANTTASTTGDYGLLQDSTATFTYNPSTNTLTVGTVSGNLTGNVTGNVTGSSGSTTGNAATATALQTARTIGGVSFDGTANIDLPGVNTTGNQDTTGNAATATTATTATNATNVALTNTPDSAWFYLPFANGSSTGNYALGVDSGISYNPSSNTLSTSTINAIIINPAAIDFSDGSAIAQLIRFGNSDDVKFFYDGTANTMEMELEAAATSFIITDNGTTKFTFTKSTGDLAATSFTGNLTGNVTGNVTGNADTATSATSATTATTANGLNTSNDYQVNSLGVGTAGSATTGEIRATDNITAYYSSDARLKENVEPIGDALDKLDMIRGVTYDWTDSYIESKGGEDGYFVRKNDVGVIAQEVERVLPQIVGENAQGFKAVRYERLTALLVEAVKELRSEVQELRAEVKALRGD